MGASLPNARSFFFQGIGPRLSIVLDDPSTGYTLPPIPNSSRALVVVELHFVIRVRLVCTTISPAEVCTFGGVVLHADRDADGHWVLGTGYWVLGPADHPADYSASAAETVGGLLAIFGSLFEDGPWTDARAADGPRAGPESTALWRCCVLLGSDTVLEHGRLLNAMNAHGEVTQGAQDGDAPCRCLLSIRTQYAQAGKYLEVQTSGPGIKSRYAVGAYGVAVRGLLRVRGDGRASIAVLLLRVRRRWMPRQLELNANFDRARTRTKSRLQLQKMSRTQAGITDPGPPCHWQCTPSIRPGIQYSRRVIGIYDKIALAPPYGLRSQYLPVWPRAPRVSTKGWPGYKLASRGQYAPISESISVPICELPVVHLPSGQSNMRSLFQSSSRPLELGIVVVLFVTLSLFATTVAGYPTPKPEMAPYGPRMITVRDAGGHNRDALDDNICYGDFIFNHLNIRREVRTHVPPLPIIPLHQRPDTLLPRHPNHRTHNRNILRAHPAWLQKPDPYTDAEKAAYLAEYAALGPAILRAEGEPDPVRREAMLSEADERLAKLALRPRLFRIAVAGEE
ncbi:hypothetical protein EVG20_g10574 [Dentipellis fragilis]|uniref:Uncharacterized protein n=1 Tax=Dentipellis fragilis TaxID=205917 RepID=A0A4Y9XQM3_9AGAM|nr:hypothetical protein EVG20_g10574 [Dentipellis fragilis]